jgi:hypothetical protein
MRPERVRRAHADPTSARQSAAFVVWGWPGWIWGIMCWLAYVYCTYPTAGGVYRGEYGPMSPIQWIGQSFLYAFVFVPPLIAVLYAGWVFFVVLRVTADGITVGRWFGARPVSYRSSDITTWRFVDRRSRDVSDAKSASRLRIDFADGSWVRVSRYGWNFRGLEAWLRQRAHGAARPVWQLPDDRPSSAFVVRDLRTMLLGIVAWVISWVTAGCCAILILALRSRPSSGHVIENAVMFFVFLILGPLAGHLTLKSVRVEASRIHVRRWFGLIRRTYHDDDIKWWRVSLDPNPPWWREAREASLVLHFAAGPTLVVAGHAANFHGLHEYVRARASSRQVERKKAGKA